MNTDYGFSNNFLSKYDFGGYTTGQFNYASGNYTKNENTDITIITDDGDRVTISAATGMESTYSSYGSLLRSGSSSLRAEGYEYQSQLRSNFSMSIVGDLDSEEYDDVISALETIDSIMKIVSSGNIKDLQAAAEKFGGLESLSSLSATIHVNESISYEQVQSVISEGDHPDKKDSKELKALEKLDNALDRLLNSGKNNGNAYGRVKQLMDDHLTEMLDSFAQKTEKKKFSREAGKLMKDMIMNRLVEKSQEEGDISENISAESQ